MFHACVNAPLLLLTDYLVCALKLFDNKLHVRNVTCPLQHVCMWLIMDQDSDSFAKLAFIYQLVANI